LLVVDSAARDLLLATLAEAGYVVTEVAGGWEALELLQLNLPRKRPHRLVVLLNQAPLDVDGTGFLHASADDAHVAVHYAQIVLLPAEDPVS
jgi:hypothetical protein